MATCYERFTALNHGFKQLCTTWQVEGQPFACIAQLHRIDAAVHDICDELQRCFEHFTHYGRRFTAALARLDAGSDDAFTRPMSGSYHDIWMELHQDLLLTLGRRRTGPDGD
jgi:hypothetical protein